MRVSFALLFAIACAMPSVEASVPSSLYWVDGESGRLNGRPFRLYKVDAPEIGAVGAALRGAKCEAETELGAEARAYMNNLTRGKPVALTGAYGVDAMGRQLVDLEVEGKDLRETGLAAGMLKVWREQGHPEGKGKPDWCGERLGL